MQGSCNDGAAMSTEDWRVEVELADAEGATRLHAAVSERELVAHARKTLAERAVLSVDGRLIFAYATTHENAQAAQRALEQLAEEEKISAKFTLSRWHPATERWEDPDVPLEVADEGSDAGHEDPDEAPKDGVPQLEVRVTLPTHKDAVELARRLAAEGIPCQRHWRYLLLGVESDAEGEALETRIREEAPPGTEVVIEQTFGAAIHTPGGQLLARAVFSPFVPF